MPIDIKRYIKMKHSPVLSLLETAEEIKRSTQEQAHTIREKLKEELASFIEKIDQLVEQKASELEKRLQESADQQNVLMEKITLLKGDKGVQGDKGESGESIKGDKGDRGERGEVGERGIQGLPGENGHTPIKGIDYFDGEKGEKGDRGVDGKPGKNGSPDTGKEIVIKVNELPIRPELQIDASHIKNLPRQKTTKKLGGKGIGGGGVTELAATGTIDGINTSFTFTIKPTYIVSDGIEYRENKGWTFSGLTATMSIPPESDIYGKVI